MKIMELTVKEYEKLMEKQTNNEEDKDIPLIPNDELNIMTGFGEKKNDKLNYNFKVLKEKVNQLIEEFNEYRKEDK